MTSIEGELPSGRPKRTLRGNSEPLGALFPRLPLRLRSRDRRRIISNATPLVSEIRSQSASRSGSQVHDRLGLHLVCDSVDPRGDIIFVHGLGGTERKTWSWNREVEHFWPSWLADEEELSLHRVFTFGYNSNFKGAGTNLNITDFAKDLLLQMLIFSGGSGEYGNDRIPIGRRKIFFVGHSMGGLVIKKAYILGKYDPEYAAMIVQVHGIVFLATPHRGAQYAKMLNNILSAAPLGAPPKAYIADLDTRSTALQDINEQFRTACGNLALVSFFETLKTSFGVTKTLVRVESDVSRTFH